MSLRRNILNTSLRWFEKPALARATSPDVLRRSLEMKARFWFHGPRGTEYRKQKVGGIPHTWVRASGADTGRVILYFHGGGYVFGSARTHRAMLAHLSARAGVVACLPDYRLAPENPFPAALDDARRSWQALLAQGISAHQIVLGGDSAGGGLALALLGDLIARKQPVPAGVFALSPLTDMTFSGASFRTNAASDAMLPANRAHDMAGMYLAGHDPQDPLVSPLMADMLGAPPVFLTAGTTEILVDDTRRMADRLREDGAEVHLEIVEDCPHVWPLFYGLIPEAARTLQHIADWLSPLWKAGGES